MSLGGGILEYMFDDVDDADLVAMVEEATRAQASAAARRSAVIGELVARRIGDDMNDPRAWWACDMWDSLAAEIAAAMNISHRKASGQMCIAEKLRDRLPKLAALYEQGRISERVISTITWRTRLISDDQVWAEVDDVLARRAQKWGPLPDEKMVAAVDAVIGRFDRGAVITARRRSESRDFRIGSYDDEDGVTTVWGRISAAEAAVFDKRLEAMIATVCEHDPRTVKQRRSAAAGAILNGNDFLPCACGRPDCPADEVHRVPASSVVVHVLADHTALQAAQQQAAQQQTTNLAEQTVAVAENVSATMDSVENTPPAVAADATEETPPAEDPPAAAEPKKAACRDNGTVILSGREVLPTAMLAELLANGATLQPLNRPDGQPEPQYRPSAKLARWIRGRDLTCRFPGCTTPAEFCDIDHVVPYPIGPTHPSNLACLCRKHHHLKTFWTGDWAVTLLRDARAIWTSPTGRTYTTHPGCRSLFPEWDVTTAELPSPPPGTRETDPTLKMPMRKRTRAAERDARIKAERELNNPEHALNDSDPPDPPPF